MSLFYDQKIPRLSFGHLPTPAKKMELNAMQLESYKKFIGADGIKKEDSGIHSALDSLFPIESVSGYARLEYVDYELVDDIYDTYDCKRYGTIYGAELKVKLRLVVYDPDSPKDNKKIKHKIEEEVSLGDMPLMTSTGSFIVNGTERVVVSQLHRSPGVFFVHDKGKSHASRKLLYQARIIPYRGSWLDFEFDVRDRVYFRIDRKRKMPVTILLKALGYTAEEILAEFYDSDKVRLGADDQVTIDMPPTHLRDLVAPHDIISSGDEALVKAGERVLPYHIRQLEEAGIQSFAWSVDALYGRVLACDIVSNQTGEVICFANQPITEEVLALLQDEGINTIEIIYTNDTDCGPYISQSMALDSCVNRTSALFEIYHMIRPGDPTNKESAELLFENCFFNEDRYSLSAIGRMKLNVTVKSDETTHLLTKDDIVGVIKHLIAIRQGQQIVDDIDSLGNRRVRSVGEMVENQFRLGLLRIDRAIQDGLGSSEVDTMTPKDFLNAKPVNAAIKEFFATGQMSQFMDQNNPLSEITHKRRITVLGPGGLSRDRSGFEVRDVHTTHYGRLCPIETPEGPNIGLINSLTTFAKTDDYGFLITPYFVVKDGVVTDEMVYCSVGDEKDKVIAQADQLGANGATEKDDLVPVRVNNEFMLKPVNEIDYMDVSPKQIVSIAASLIPFLEHDDANRALMGSNMQRQAIPVLRREKPYVGTGVESIVAIESGTVVVAKRSGEVVSVDSKRIVIKADAAEAADDVGIDIYNLIKYQKSNHNTCVDQTPIVAIGSFVRAGDVIADGSCTDNGELALGQNVRIAFMSWNGYNFEDSIVISERLIQQNHFTSIHIEEFSCIARSTKLGDEEITADVPNITSYLSSKLDDSGIVHLGAEVQSGDILVGKITPKGETQLTPEEKLLRAVFGEKASDVKDSSLRMSSGISGTVVDVQVQTRGSNYHNDRSREIERERLQQIDLDEQEEMAMLTKVYEDLRGLLLAYVDENGDNDGKLAPAKIEKMTEKQLLSVRANNKKISGLQKKITSFGEQIKQKYENKRKVVTGPSSLSPGVLTVVKVFVAIKRNIQPGDKMAGRHGNKGVISAVVPMEDMPYDENGVPVDMILNPLGVPSRMNVGQILETHLGMASRELGNKIDTLIKQQKSADMLRDCLQEIYGDTRSFAEHSEEDVAEVAGNLRRGVPFATPVFDGAKEADIAHMLRLGGINESGKITLYDGRTGSQFDQPVTVGYMYMLKLNHLVDDKMHARSTGSYSLVTQQPLGGKAQFGGQRFGEMEVWALEAYGASYTLQEMLTVKSDDMEGRKKMYKSIAEGEQYTEFGIPESFNVLVREIRSLGLDIDIE